MGIYLPNMEMPRKGQMLVIFPDGTSYVCFNGMRERLAQTDAILVPPHGALIDRDALMKILSKVIDINASIEQRNEATDQERRCLWWFEQQIGIAPTIIPAEEGE